MYCVVNTFQQAIIGSIKPQEVAEYEWLQKSAGQAMTTPYQQRYKKFWAMNVARLSSGFYSAYFSLLNHSTAGTTTLPGLCEVLHQSSRRINGTQTIQFSFATKLLHTLNPRTPIYDSRVARFFLFREPSSDLPIQQRIGRLVAFHTFLSVEYTRVIKNRLLANPIAAFRLRFNPQNHTDEKIIDWLVWAFVGLVDNGHC